VRIGADNVTEETVDLRTMHREAFGDQPPPPPPPPPTPPSPSAQLPTSVFNDLKGRVGSSVAVLVESALVENFQASDNEITIICYKPSSASWRAIVQNQDGVYDAESGNFLSRDKVPAGKVFILEVKAAQGNSLMPTITTLGNRNLRDMPLRWATEVIEGKKRESKEEPEPPKTFTAAAFVWGKKIRDKDKFDEGYYDTAIQAALNIVAAKIGVAVPRVDSGVDSYRFQLPETVTGYMTHISLMKAALRRKTEEWVNAGKPEPTAQQIAALPGVKPHATIEVQSFSGLERPHCYLFDHDTPAPSRAGTWVKLGPLQASTAGERKKVKERLFRLE
jgi:hypothetical protein